ncbi:hypothetical protein BGZ73_006791 [Actinomortierella ambigua]|nr:hypothetical protein BGZ73_006791 [Actinomortierella ambigua]
MSHEYDPNIETDSLPQLASFTPYDPNLETPTRIPTILLHLTNLPEDNVASDRNWHFFFNMAKSDRPDQDRRSQIPLKSFSKGSDITYTATRLNTISTFDGDQNARSGLGISCRLAWLKQPDLSTRSGIS